MSQLCGFRVETEVLGFEKITWLVHPGGNVRALLRTEWQGPPWKWVDWAYPTSPNAEKFKAPAGCWVVNVGGPSGAPKAVAAYPTKEEAMNHAAGLGLPWASFQKGVS